VADSNDMPTPLRVHVEDLYRALFDRALDATLVADDDGRCLDANDAALAMLGIGRDELARKRVTDFVRAGVEVRTVRDVLPGRHLITLREVTEHGDAEAVARLAAIVEVAQDAISGCDPDGRLNYWSPSAERVYGWTAAEAIGKPAAMLMVDPDDWTRIRDALHRGEVVRNEALRKRKDGTRFHASVTVAPVMRDGVMVGASALTRDVSDKYLLEQQLALTDRLATAGTLAAGIAHEINNPLAVMIANLEHVAPALASDESMREVVADARVAAQRIAEIVRELRFLANPGDLSLKMLDVREVLASTVRIAAQEIRARAQLVTNYQPVPRVLANPARLGQVLVSLVVNASQAIAEGDSTHNEVTITTRTDAQGRAVVSVRDTGKGIAPEHVHRIFDPFFTTRPVGSGAGLGLAICHRLVTEMGGTIQVHSSDRGSTFEVALPPAPEPITSPAPSDPTPRTGKRKILVIDDEPIVGRAVRRVLQPVHDVTAVTSARAALDLLEQGERFDLILCDLMMPHMTGMELHDHLYAHAPAVAARMVFLTGGAFTPAARAFVERVANPCFEKPFDANQLRELAAKHLV